MNLLNKFLKQIDFADYDDFSKNFKIEIPQSFNFAYDVVDEYARLCPEKQALLWANDKGESRAVNFGELKTITDKTANMFANLAVNKGDFVMLMLRSRIEYWFAIVALHKIGAVAIPATHLLTKKDIDYRVKTANVKMIICTDEQEICKDVFAVQKENDCLKHIMCLENVDNFLHYDTEYQKASELFDKRTNIKNSDALLAYFTSGTTGYPKMAMHSHIYPLGHIITAKYWHNVIDDGLHFTNADTGWAKSSWGKIYGQWIAGSSIFVYDYEGKFTPTDLLPLLAKFKVTTFCAPPTVYRFIIKEDLSKYDFSSIKYLTTAGEPLNPEIFRKIKEYTGLEIHEGFGQSETVCMLATTKSVKPKLGSMGKPMPIYDIKILDNDGKEVPRGEDGELCIRMTSKNNTQIGLFTGYHNAVQKTKEVMYDGFYHTGDLVYRDEDDYFWFVGRKDDIIKSSGYRIGPFEVESALMEHPAVLECAITGVPDDLRGQVVKATIVLAKGYEASDTLKKNIQDYVKHTTAPYKYPRIVEFVSALPKTTSGKIKRSDIRKQDA